jgi:saccharopine dehydrogenase (NAD+, L-lysine-forming)
MRIFKDDEFESIGCTMAETGTWRDAPLDAYIFGLKELPEGDNSPLKHTHIMFAHCYKNQDQWDTVLSRWVRGGGLLLDLEFLMLNNRRVAAYGYYAGFAGCAVGLDVWAHQILHPGVVYPKINPFANEQKLIAFITERLQLAGNYLYFYKLKNLELILLSWLWEPKVDAETGLLISPRP